MRLFLGAFAKIKFYDEIKGEFSKHFNGKWVEWENLHTTVYFFGNRELDEVEKILSNIDLGELKETPKLKGLNLIKTKYTTLLYTQYQSSKFKYINREILKAEGEKIHDFLPHVTLLRIKNIIDDEYQTILKKYENSEIGELETKLCLVQSTLSRKGPTYKIIKSF